MSNTNEQLSKREQYMIESYKEQTAAWRHENNLLYRFTTILLPVSIAALGVPYVQQDVPDFLATLGGLTLMTFWALSCQIIETKSNLRFSIINEIEECWDIASHKDLITRKKNTYGQKASYFLRSHNLRCWLFRIYLFLVVGLTVWRGIYTTWSVGRVTTIVVIELVVILLVSWLSYIIADWAMQKADKPVRAKDTNETTKFGSDN